jgi:hypothetical protein
VPEVEKSATPQHPLILLAFLHFLIRNMPVRCCGFKHTETLYFTGIVAVLRIFQG